MIIWLASYPKSGNTWIRSFLTTIMYSADGKNEFKHLNKIKQFPALTHFKKYISDYKNVDQLSKSWIAAQQTINIDNKVRLFKTHHVNCKIGNDVFTDNNNTLGVIHIVRDPRNVVTSIKNHYSLPNIEKAKNFIFDENMWIKRPQKTTGTEDDEIVPTLISSWKTNYLSWKNKSKNYLLIRYEDLLNNPRETFPKVTKFISNLMNIDIEQRKIEEAIVSNSFESLQKLEEKGMFEEYNHRVDKKKGFKFFNLGPKNTWQNILDPKISNEISERFSKEMKELNYI